MLEYAIQTPRDAVGVIHVNQTRVMGRRIPAIPMNVDQEVIPAIPAVPIHAQTKTLAYRGINAAVVLIKETAAVAIRAILMNVTMAIPAPMIVAMLTRAIHQTRAAPQAIPVPGEIPNVLMEIDRSYNHKVKEQHAMFRHYERHTLTLYFPFDICAATVGGHKKLGAN
jgi:hypothetical protein